MSKFSGWVFLVLFVAGCAGGADSDTPAEPEAGNDPEIEAPVLPTVDPPDENPGNTGFLPEPPLRTVKVPRENPLLVVPAPGSGVTPLPSPKPEGPSLLEVTNGNKHPTRIATSPSGAIFVTDALAGSVFLYDENLVLQGEVKNIGRPLGLTVDQKGRLLVGDDGADCIKVFELDGEPGRSIAKGVSMPNDLTTDVEGNLYVVDSRSNNVRVFDADGDWVRDIGAEEPETPGKLSFPVSVVILEGASGAVGAREVLVADQGNGRIVVFSEDGIYLREIGEPMEAFSSDWEGRFARLQAIISDANGDIHALDSHTRRVQVFSPEDGQLLGAYGMGEGLKLPLDLGIVPGRGAVLTDAGARRLHTIEPFQAGGAQ